MTRLWTEDMAKHAHIYLFPSFKGRRWLIRFGTHPHVGCSRRGTRSPLKCCRGRSSTNQRQVHACTGARLELTLRQFIGSATPIHTSTTIPIAGPTKTQYCRPQACPCSGSGGPLATLLQDFVRTGRVHAWSSPSVPSPAHTLHSTSMVLG